MTTENFQTGDHVTAPRVRCSDAEREAVSETLHRAVGEGRLTIDEGEDRLGKVYEARYRGDLAALTADLPADEPVTISSRLSTAWAAVCTKVALQIAILFGRHAASWRRRALAALALLGPVLVVLALAAGVLHGVTDWQDADHGYGHHAVQGRDGGNPEGA
ncbi:DUF1707 domain-containing protein [Pseudonocardia sp. N23]|uniref:DUF1707 SHOCT-like domain-containing protein n=1 Tax=Pseudonocardia sp. N23 TaxID=1987376 RepID=UPI000BFE1B42|nr:DUF1707 domain-containing protein [Pseudonocardia sp. N23]GAY13051.1 hypothetical protein TOK_1780 [Pseudonocardia sp. N23]